MPETDLPLDALHPDPRNARIHSPRNLALIADATSATFIGVCRWEALTGETAGRQPAAQAA